MYNDLSKLKLNLMIVRKAFVRVALVSLLVYLVLGFSTLSGWVFEELSKFSQISFIALFTLIITMFILEDEVQKIMNKSPFSFGEGGVKFYEPEFAMKTYTESKIDDLFSTEDEGSELEVEDRDPEIIALEKENEEYWENKLKSIPERTRSDFMKRATALRVLEEKHFDLLRNEFLAHVFGTPEGNELPEGQDELTFNPEAYHHGTYLSKVLVLSDMSRSSWVHYQNGLKDLFKDEYQINFDDEGNVSYYLK